MKNYSPLIFLIFFVSIPTIAQTYKCNNGAYYSNQPCGNNPQSRIGGYGPQTTISTYSISNNLPKADAPSEHIKYLSPTCSSLYEAIRTARSRGIKPDGQRALYLEYQQKCDIEDQSARQKQRQEVENSTRLKISAQNSITQQQTQIKENKIQCAAMRDTIALKRKRESSLNPQEIESLRNFETSYNQKCI
jgi:hypothetical protein